MSKYGTITSLAESPLDRGPALRRHRRRPDPGHRGRRRDLAPDRPPARRARRTSSSTTSRPTCTTPTRSTSCVDNHKTGDFAPYLLKSTDRGRTWTVDRRRPARAAPRLAPRPGPRRTRSCSSPAPSSASSSPSTAAAAGSSSTGGVPNIPFRDLAIQRRENDLVGATFGRGFYVLDDYTPLREVTEELLEQRGGALPGAQGAGGTSRSGRSGGGEKATQGAAFFTAPNPPFGAVFTYYLRDELADPQGSAPQAREGARGGGRRHAVPRLGRAAARGARGGAGDPADRARRRRRRRAPPRPARRRPASTAWPGTCAIPSPERLERRAATDERRRRRRRASWPRPAPTRVSLAQARRRRRRPTSAEPQTFEVVPLREPDAAGHGAGRRMVAFLRRARRAAARRRAAPARRSRRRQERLRRDPARR